jgi:hypothetical protein
MARQTFRLNLGSAEFPLLNYLYGRSIVFPQQDMHYIRPNAFSGSEADKNIGIPQLMFCENVMPASYGYQSIAFNAAIQGTTTEDFDQAFYLRDAAENRTLFVPGVTGTSAKRYTYDATTNTWNNSTITIPSGAKCTVANLKSRTFIKFEFDDQFFEWNGAWAAIAFPALTAANIKGIVAANAYLIGYDRNTIYWSSTLDPTDFLPSLVTGAGSQRILANKGSIVVCYPIDDGFVIYTTVNTIIARFSSNIRFPWTFKEVKNSAGIDNNQEHASPQGDGNNLYVYTTNGLMTYGVNKAQQEFPAVNEFFGCREMEVWNAVTKDIEAVTLADKFKIKIEFVANRWLVISYGETTLTHALVYDTALKRWGKLRIDHVDCFEFFGNPGTVGSIIPLTWAQLSGTWAQQNNTWAEYGGIISGGAASLTVPYRSLAFLQADGQVRVVDFTFATKNDDAVLIIGRLQFLRNNQWTIQEIEAEQMGPEVSNKMQLWSSLDGLNYKSKIYPYQVVRTGRTQKWNSRVSAITHALVFEGNFNLNTIIARGTQGGKR